MNTRPDIYMYICGIIPGRSRTKPLFSILRGSRTLISCRCMMCLLLFFIFFFFFTRTYPARTIPNHTSSDRFSIRYYAFCVSFRSKLHNFIPRSSPVRYTLEALVPIGFSCRTFFDRTEEMAERYLKERH